MKQRVAHLLLTIVVFTYIVFEELVWETIARPIYDYIHSLGLLRKLEERLRHLHPWLLLGIFLLIFAGVELLGVMAGLLFVSGHFVTGAMLYTGKIPVTAFAFWLFRVSEDKLLRIRWFSMAYNFVMEKIAWLKNSEIYRTIKSKTARIKAKIKLWKMRYLPRGELKREIKRIYLQIKKIFKKERL